MRYQEFEPHRFSQLRKRLIKEKGDNFQRDFLVAALERTNFQQWLDEYITVMNKDALEPTCCTGGITEEEFRHPTIEIERMIFASWSDLTPREACRPSFWGHLSAMQIRQGIIEPNFLAVNGQPGISGHHRITQSLERNDAKAMDDVVRTILRRFCGLPEVRGGLRSVSVDCTFASAWWRQHMTREIVSSSGYSEEGVSRVLRTSKTYWEKLMLMIISKNSVLGDDKVRSALVGALANHLDNKHSSRLFVGPGLEACVRRIGIRSAWQELAVFEMEEINQMICNEIFPTIHGTT